jgi:hypothetical protein
MVFIVSQQRPPSKTFCDLFITNNIIILSPFLLCLLFTLDSNRHEVASDFFSSVTSSDAYILFFMAVEGSDSLGGFLFTSLQLFLCNKQGTFWCVAKVLFINLPFLFKDFSYTTETLVIDANGKLQTYDEMEEEEAIEVKVMGEEVGWNGWETQEEIEKDVDVDVEVDDIVDSCSENSSNQMESTSENKSFLMANVKIAVDSLNEPVNMDDSTARKSIPIVNVDSIAEKNSILRNNPNSKAKDQEEKIRWVNSAICVVKDETVKREHIFFVKENKQNRTESEEKMVETQIILSNHGDRAEKNRTVSGCWESKAEKFRNSTEQANGAHRIMNNVLEPTDSAQNNMQIQVDHADSPRDIKIATVELADTAEIIPVEHEDTLEENIPAESATNKGENLNSGIEDQCITQEDKDFLWKVWTAEEKAEQYWQNFNINL